MAKIDELIEEYKRLQEDISVQEQALAGNLDIFSIERNISALEIDLSKLKEELVEKKASYLSRTDFARNRQNEIKSAITDNWGKWKIEGKTHKSTFGTATLRVTKSVIVESKAKIIEVLTKNNKLVEGVSRFDLRFLRKLKDVGLLPDDAVTLEENKSVTIKLVGLEEVVKEG